MFVTATPPGRGLSAYPQWIARLAVHVLGVFTGALAVAALLFAAGELTLRPPLWIVGALAVGLALVAARVLPVSLSGSRWRVPQEWARFGPVGYAGAFGVALGTGVATRIGSPAMYAVLAWGLAAPQWSLVWPAFAAFAAGRAVPFLAIAARSQRRGTYTADQLGMFSGLVGRLWLVESAVLAALAVHLLS